MQVSILFEGKGCITSIFEDNLGRQYEVSYVFAEIDVKILHHNCLTFFASHCQSLQTQLIYLQLLYHQFLPDYPDEDLFTLPLFELSTPAQKFQCLHLSLCYKDPFGRLVN